MVSSNESKWHSSFNKSLLDNAQLSFSRKINISVISKTIINNNTIEEPLSELLDIHELDKITTELAEEINNKPITVFIDNRTSFYKALENNNQAFLSTYFPLTKEKYRMQCYSVLLNTKNMSSLDKEIKININQDLVVNSLLKYSKNNNEDIDTINRYFKNSTSKIINSLKNNSDDIIKNYWSKLTEEEKLQFEVIEPETFKANTRIEDIDKFDSQEKIEPINNFSVVLFFPYVIEHSIYPKPQVVANSRKPNFESLYKPRKMLKKYVFWSSVYNSEETKKENLLQMKWELRELNP